MNREVLYEAITNINDRFIEEADPEAGSGYMPRIRRLRPILNTAAVLLVVFGLTTVALRSGLLSGAKSEAPAAEAPMVAQFALTTESAYDAAGEETVMAAAESAPMEAAPRYEEAVEAEAEPAAGETPAEIVADATDSDHFPADNVREEFADHPVILEAYPDRITWNGAEYLLCEELISELPELAVSSGLLENTEDALFYAASEVVLGMQIFASPEGDFLYLAFGELWAVYAK